MNQDLAIQIWKYWVQKKSAKRFVLKNVNVNREWFYGFKKNDFGQSFIVIVEKYDITLIVLFQKATINEN